MSTRITRKRARTDADEDVADVKPDPSHSDIPGDDATRLEGANLAEKDADFWFEDGTIILQTGNVEFRVYGGLLEGHSTVFKELFAQSHPTRAVSIAGRTDFLCPVITLSDSPHDLRYVLRGCMPKQAGSLCETTTPSFDMISAAIRLGQKYNIPGMYQKGLAFLKGFYTDDFDTWVTADDWAPPGWVDVEAVGVINLARLTGELSLLPTAFMACALSEEANPVHGFAREDGSREHLTLDDLSICFEAKGRLREAGVAGMFRVLSTHVAPTCKVASQCSKAFKTAFRGSKIEERVRTLMMGDMFLDTAATCFEIENEQDKYALCQPCLDMIRQREENENRAIWDRLPELVGIDVPGWKVAALPALA